MPAPDGGEYRDCIAKIYRKEGGIKALYRGVAPTLVGIVPYAAINFATYETLKLKALATPSMCQEDGGLLITTRLMCGGFAGAFGQTVVYPLDTVRRR